MNLLVGADEHIRCVQATGLQASTGGALLRRDRRRPLAPSVGGAASGSLAWLRIPLVDDLWGDSYRIWPIIALS